MEQIETILQKLKVMYDDFCLTKTALDIAFNKAKGIPCERSLDARFEGMSLIDIAYSLSEQYRSLNKACDSVYQQMEELSSVATTYGGMQELKSEYHKSLSIKEKLKLLQKIGRIM